MSDITLCQNKFQLPNLHSIYGYYTNKPNKKFHKPQHGQPQTSGAQKKGNKYKIKAILLNILLFLILLKIVGGFKFEQNMNLFDEVKKSSHIFKNLEVFFEKDLMTWRFYKDYF